MRKKTQVSQDVKIEQTELTDGDPKYCLPTRAFWTDQSLTGEQLQFLGYLKTYDLPDASNGGARKGKVYVKPKTVARDMEVTERHARRIITSLVEGGYAERIREGCRFWIRFTIPDGKCPLFYEYRTDSVQEYRTKNVQKYRTDSVQKSTSENEDSSLASQENHNADASPKIRTSEEKKFKKNNRPPLTPQRGDDGGSDANNVFDEKKQEPGSKPEVEEIIEWFCHLYQRHQNRTYIRKRPDDEQAVIELLAIMGRTELFLRLLACFKYDHGEWLGWRGKFSYRLSAIQKTMDMYDPDWAGPIDPILPDDVKQALVGGELKQTRRVAFLERCRAHETFNSVYANRLEPSDCAAIDNILENFPSETIESTFEAMSDDYSLLEGEKWTLEDFKNHLYASATKVPEPVEKVPQVDARASIRAPAKDFEEKQNNRREFFQKYRAEPFATRVYSSIPEPFPEMCADIDEILDNFTKNQIESLIADIRADVTLRNGKFWTVGVFKKALYERTVSKPNENVEAMPSHFPQLPPDSSALGDGTPPTTLTWHDWPEQAARLADIKRITERLGYGIGLECSQIRIADGGGYHLRIIMAGEQVLDVYPSRVVMNGEEAWGQDLNLNFAFDQKRLPERGYRAFRSPVILVRSPLQTPKNDQN